MKKIIICATVVGLMLSTSSCSLEENVYTQVDKSLITDATMAETLLWGIYKGISVDGIYRHNLSMVFALPTDEAKIEGSSLVDVRLEGSNAYGTSSTYVQNTWSALYAAVYEANYFLETMEEKMASFSEKDQKLCEVYVAEAHALRGLLYFELVRWFGNVPLIVSTEQSYWSPSQYTQEKPEVIYQFIEKDLKYAVKNLPYAINDDVRSDNSFRISKGGALGLLAKVYATWAGYPVQDESKWALAVSTAQELISSGNHSLLADFEQLWKNAGSNVWNATESLIEISYYSPLSTNTSSGRVGNFNGVRASAGGLRGGNHGHNAFFRICPTFLTDWKDPKNDKRWAISYADYQYTSEGKKCMVQKTVDGVPNSDVTFLMAWEATHADWNDSWRTLYGLHLFPRKWDTEVYVPDDNNLVDNNYTNINWYVLRYADVLLLYAEALNEVNNGPTSEAYEAVNMVRRRAYGLNITTPSDVADLEDGLSYENFRQAVRDERSWELAFEGHRRQDLIRWGIYYETVSHTYQHLADWSSTAPSYYLAGIYTTKNKHELLPIPQREMDLCKKFKQNPGWK